MLEAILKVSKSINEKMKILHESLVDLEAVFNEYFVGEDSFLIQEAVTLEGMERMIDTTSSLVDEINTMGEYADSIFEDMDKVINVDEDLLDD